MVYREWQMDKSSIPDNIKNAYQNFLDKFGQPPKILETGMELKDVELPEGLQLVVRSQRIPKNIMLMGMVEIEEHADN